MAALEFRVLGPLEVRRRDEVVAVTAPKQRVLLSLLLLRRGRPVPQDELIDVVWAGSPPPTARAAALNLVHALRRHLGHHTLERTPAGYLLRVEPDALDLERFRRLCAAARTQRTEERAVSLREALALWRGTAFVELAGNPRCAGEIARLDDERLNAVEDRIDADLERGEHTLLVPELREHVSREPLRERLWFQLMLALYRAGRQADALAAYRQAHHAFATGLGIEPGVVLRELQRAILVHDRSLDDPTRVLGSTLERAAAILPREPRERAESLLEYGGALIRLGELRQAAPTLQAAARLARSAGEAGLEERTRILLSYLAVFSDGDTGMLEHLSVAERAADTLQELHDSAGVAFALLHQAQMLREIGDAERGLVLAERAAEVAARVGDVRRAAECHRVAAQCAALGPLPIAEAFAYCDAADAAMEEGRLYSAWDTRVWLLAQVRRLDEARTLYERELRRLRDQGVGLNLMVGITRVALAERAGGDCARAAGFLQEAYELARSQNAYGDLPALAAELASVLALRGDLDGARRLAEETRTAHPPDDVLSETLWRRALALVDAHEGRHEEALRLAQEARAIAGRTDWLTFRGETAEDAAVVHRLARDDAGERDALAAALRDYELKGNVVGAERVRAALTTVGRPPEILQAL